MPRLTAGEWADIRAEREACGTPFQVLATKFGVDKAAIVRRSKKEGWGDGGDVEAVIRRKVSEKVTGMSPTDLPEKKAAAVDAEAARRAAVVERHKREWDDHQCLIADAIERGDFEAAKLAKITSETIRIRQDGERKAWGLDDNSIKIDVSRASDAELEALIKAKAA